MAEQFQDYLIEYPHDGGHWTFKIQATSFEDAERRCKQIYYGNVLGTVEMEIPAVAPAAVPGFFCWLRNWLLGRAA